MGGGGDGRPGGEGVGGGCGGSTGGGGGAVAPRWGTAPADTNMTSSVHRSADRCCRGP